MCMGFHPESGGICISENNGYHRFQGYPLVLFNTTLHHSQTSRVGRNAQFLFEYHLLLHHSQTGNGTQIEAAAFEYHLLLHHSQTSNSKMKCHHLHKVWYSNALIDFTSIFIYNIMNPPFQASPFLVFDK